MYLTDEEREKLKMSCYDIRDYLKYLVKDQPKISLEVKFSRRRDGHPMGISVNKYNGKTEVRGFTGGLGIVFEGDGDYNHSLAWGFQEYGLELIAQWYEIKCKFNKMLNDEMKERKSLMDFKV